MLSINLFALVNDWEETSGSGALQAPAENSPTSWDGKNRQTVAIIVIDECKNKLAYKQTSLCDHIGTGAVLRPSFCHMWYSQFNLKAAEKKYHFCGLT
jgi:hypothetical protein